MTPLVPSAPRIFRRQARPQAQVADTLRGPPHWWGDRVLHVEIWLDHGGVDVFFLFCFYVPAVIGNARSIRGSSI